MKSRREILKALGAATLAHPLSGFAQQAQKVRRIGFLGSGTQGPSPVRMASLQRLGYEEGRNLVIERRFAENNPERLPLLADELVRLNVELIMTDLNPGTLAAKRATRTIPVVMTASSATVENGFIDSLARPGGNITGVDWAPGPSMAEKGYQLLKESVPGATRAIRLWNPMHLTAHQFGDEHLRRIASNTGLTVVNAGITRPKDLAGALDQVVASRAELLYVAGDEGIPPLFGEIAAFAVKRKMVSLGSHPNYPVVGGLLCYSANVVATVDRVSSYIDRILRGAKPGDLPVEYPSKFELVLNSNSAKAIGVTFPRSFMLQVDRTID